MNSSITLLCLIAAAAASPALAEPPAETEHRSTLTRVREGGTPYDATQPLVPYPVRIGGPEGTAASLTGAVALVETPPEYAPARGVLFQYGNSWNSVVTACVVALTASSAHDEIAYVVVANQTTANSAASAFAAAGADMTKVVLIVHPNDSIWMRDYGPHFVFEGGTLGIVDSHYYQGRALDNFVPTLLAGSTWQVNARPQGLYYSGGNFQAGPDRSGFCTALVNVDNPASGGFNESLIRELHGAFQGIDTLHVLPQLPTSVDGTGHIDMWMYLVDEDTVIISEFIAGSNATAISVTNNAVPYMQALGFEVFRTPAWNAGFTHFTYTNAYRVNDRIFVPVYGTGIVPGGNSAYNARDTQAMAQWAAAAGPGVTIVPIQCSSIIGASGAIHCTVKQVPRYVGTMPAVNVEAPAAGDVVLAGSVQQIRWNASDTGNRPLASVDLAWSTDGEGWATIASGIPDSGAFAWNVPPSLVGSSVRVRVTARSADGDVAMALSGAFRAGPGTRRTYDFSQGAGVTHFATGTQTSSWGVVSGVALPISTALSAANYAALATSNATGGNTDANRYVTPAVASSSEATHVFRMRIDEPPTGIDELRIAWEGYADRCTQAELYVWNVALSQWGNPQGQVGQNRYADSWAGNRDDVLEAVIRGNVADFVAADGTVRFLVYGERPADETFHDYVAVTVTSIDAPCPADLNADRSVDGIDLGILLGAWGPCTAGACAADLDGNGTIDGVDLGVLLGAWGACP
jgi:agmatine/peptidylarginine deiminase